MQTTDVQATEDLVHDDPSTVTAEGVATVVAGVSTIGAACDALRKAGWRAVIAGNRITVEDDVFAQFIAASPRSHGPIEASWMIYRNADTAPVWAVGAERRLDVVR